MFGLSFGGDDQDDQTAGFTVDPSSSVLLVDGQNLFAACQTSSMDKELYQIYWTGDHSNPAGQTCLPNIRIIANIASPSAATRGS
jgi:hypothetical protein